MKKRSIVAFLLILCFCLAGTPSFATGEDTVQQAPEISNVSPNGIITKTEAPDWAESASDVPFEQGDVSQAVELQPIDLDALPEKSADNLNSFKAYDDFPFSFDLVSYADGKADVVLRSMQKEIFEFNIAERNEKVEEKTDAFSLKGRNTYTLDVNKEYVFSIKIDRGDYVIAYAGIITARYYWSDAETTNVTVAVKDVQSHAFLSQSSMLEGDISESTDILQDGLLTDEAIVSLLAVGTIDEDEPANNYSSTATQTWDDYNNFARIYPTKSDVDWYVVTFTSAGQANFWLGDIPVGCDYDLYVYASNATTLLGQGTSAGNINETVTLNVSAYTKYYMKVISWSGYSSVNYWLRAKNYPSVSQGDSYEVNNTQGSASLIGNNVTITNANLHSPSDVDWYRFTLGSISDAVIRLDNIPANCDFDLELYNINGQRLATSAQGGNWPEELYMSSSSGTYYLKVFPYSWVSSANYRLNLSSAAQQTTYAIQYYGNGQTSGSPPVNQSATAGSYIYLQSNIGNLQKSGYTFGGWCTNAAGTGTTYNAGQGITMPSSNLYLYAKWVPITYTINYSGNGHTSGSTPSSQTFSAGQSVTLRTNTGSLARTGFAFDGWNTQPDRKGWDYGAGQTIIPSPGNFALYTKWRGLNNWSGGLPAATVEALPYTYTTESAYANTYIVPAILQWNSISSNVKFVQTSTNPKLTIRLGVEASVGEYGAMIPRDIFNRDLSNINPTGFINQEWDHCDVIAYEDSMAADGFNTGNIIANFAHEIGHALSLEHPTHSESAIMRQGKQSIAPQESDKINLITKWGK